MERNKALKENSRNLRLNQTKEEALLWYRFLRNDPLKFRRQYIIGNYIVDFYCHKARLAVEPDGSGHYTPEIMEYDSRIPHPPLRGTFPREKAYSLREINKEANT